MNVCDICGEECNGVVIDGKSTVCNDCASTETRQTIKNMKPDQIKTLRRRIEDRLRKSPAALIETGTLFAGHGWIVIDDLI